MATTRHSGIELEDQVERMLHEANWPFQRGVVLGEARPDFLVTTENGDQIVLEVKDWDATPYNTARAINQAQLYRQLSKASAALVVTRSGKKAMFKDGGVAPISQFLSLLGHIASSVGSNTKQAKPQQATAAPSEKVFASMPFASEYDDTFLVAIEPAALTYGAIAERVDHNGSVGSVVPQIQSMIRAAKAVVADLSNSRPNVLHEVGYAEALQKPIIQICSTPTDQLPFNVRNNQTISYSIGQSAKLRKKLEGQFAQIIGKVL